MKRILTLGLTVGALGAATLRAQDTVTVGVGGELSAPLLEKLLVPVFADMRLAGGEKLGSYTIRVSWNPNIFSFNGWRSGSFAEPVVRTDSAFSYGVLWASAVSPAGRDGVFNLLDLILVPDSNGADTIVVSVTELSAAGTLTDLLATKVVRTVPGAFCPALGRWGDLDRDGRSNSRDALAVLTSVVGLPVDTLFDLALGDVDGDAKVNTRDALIILSYAVGIDIPGQRVLLVAGGICTSGAVPSLAVVPDTLDLVVGQGVEPKVFGRDAAGGLTALNNLQWEIADPRVAVVSADGMVIAREPGTTVATAAVAPGVRVRATVISRARRGTWFVDAAKAKRASVQMGTSKWPFATPQFAFPHVREGDTIRVAPGVHDYEDFKCFGECPSGDYLLAGVVVIGDTLADGTRPVLRAREQDFFTAFDFEGGRHAEVRNLVLRGFYTGLYAGGLRTLVVDNVRIEEPITTFGHGIYVWGIDTLSVSRSEVLGDSTRSNSRYGILIGELANLVRISDTRVVNWGSYGIHGEDVFRFELERSEVSFNRYSGVYLYEDELDAPPSARFSYNRLVENGGAAISINGAGAVATDHNYILATNGDAITVYGSGRSFGGESPPPASGVSRSAAALAGTKLVMLADSIRVRANANWLYASDLDSAAIDSIWVENPADTIIYQYNWLQVNVASITNSRFVNLQNEAIDFRGRKLVVDNSSFTACQVCDWDRGYAIQAFAWDQGPEVWITNSLFSRLYSAVDVGDTGDSAGPIVLAGNSIDSVAYALRLSGDSVVVRDNTFTRIRDYALSASPGFSNRPFVEAWIARNRVSCSVQQSYTAFGLRHDYGPARFEDNVVKDCDWGLYAYNSPSSPLADVTFIRDSVVPASTASYHVGIRPDGRWRPRIIGNRVVGGYIGIDVTVTDTATVLVDSNAVSGTGYAGIQLYYVQGSVTGRRNNIAGNALDGILNVGTSGPRSFTLGKFNSGGVGNGRYAVNSSAPFDATQNWWGSASGAGGQFGSGLANADSVSSAQVDVSSPLTAEPSEPPPLSSPPIAAALSASPLAAKQGLQPAVAAEIDSAAPRPPDLELQARREMRDAFKRRMLERIAEEREAHRKRAEEARSLLLQLHRAKQLPH
ncbi:hypothetical protein HRbin33_00440 [bacterium HR33]|nr:hypothetical protein HRbin33_00440 [bacterium HR33]